MRLSLARSRATRLSLTSMGVDTANGRYGEIFARSRRFNWFAALRELPVDRCPSREIIKKRENASARAFPGKRARRPRSVKDENDRRATQRINASRDYILRRAFTGPINWVFARR